MIIDVDSVWRSIYIFIIRRKEKTLEDTNFDEFIKEFQRIMSKYVGTCKKNYAKNKDYNYIADSLIRSWFQRYMPTMMELDILRQFSIDVKENEECDEDKELLVNSIIDNLQCISFLDNAILSIAREIINKIKTE